MSLLAIAIYGFSTLVFLVLGVVIVYHLVKYGFIGDATKFMIIIFVIVSALLVITSSIFVAKTDWGSFNLTSNTSATIQSDKPILGY